MIKNGNNVERSCADVEADPAAACKNGINDIIKSILVLKSDYKISIENYITINFHNQ